MSESPVRAVIVGCGGMSAAWIKSAIAAPEIELVGLTDLKRENAEKRATDFELPQSLVYDTMDEALRDASPEVVFDVTVPSVHSQVTTTALKAGCHVLGEKPMAETLEQARASVKTARETGKRYSVMQNRRALAGSMSVAQFLANEPLGPIEEIHCDFFIGARFGGFRAEMAHPLLLDMAIHTFDNARQMSGADPNAVYCHTFNPGRSWYQGDGSAMAIFEMTGRNGEPVPYCYRGSWCAEGLNTSWHSAWRFVCREGTLTWDGGDDIRAEKVDTTSEDFFRPTQSIDVPRVELEETGHPHIIRQFVQSLRNGETPLTPCEDNIKSLAMVLGAIDSAAKQQRVQVEW